MSAGDDDVTRDAGDAAPDDGRENTPHAHDVTAPVHSDIWTPPEATSRHARPAQPPEGATEQIDLGATAQVRVPGRGAAPAHDAAATEAVPTASARTESVSTATVVAARPSPAAPPKQRKPRKNGESDRKSSERRLAYWLVAPAALVMLLVTGYPIIYAFWLSLNRAMLTAPDDTEFVGISNYVTVLSDGFWWTALGVTVFITLVSVFFELVFGMMIALVMHRTIWGKGVVRTVVLIPYGIVTVAAAFSWYYAWTPGTGYLANLLPEGSAPLTEQWPSLFIIILAEVWKTTPFMALLLLAGLALVPDDLLKAAQLDGAGAWTRLWRITLPLMKPAILVALLFRTLDAFRIFDNIYVLTAGNNNTGSVSMLGYNNLFKAFNLGIGSAISILIFVCVAIIAFIFIKLFGAAAPGSDNEGR